MQSTYRDITSAVLAIVGGVVVFARLESYHWWLIGSWKGAVGVLSVLGLAIMLTNILELVRFSDIPSSLEALLWLGAATAAIASLFSTTTKSEFVVTAIAIGVAWLAQTTRHVWRSNHTPRHHYLPAS